MVIRLFQVGEVHTHQFDVLTVHQDRGGDGTLLCNNDNNLKAQKAAMSICHLTNLYHATLHRTCDLRSRHLADWPARKMHHHLRVTAGGDGHLLLQLAQRQLRTPRESTTVLSSRRTMEWSSSPLTHLKNCTESGHGMERLDTARPSQNWNPIVSRCIREVVGTFFVRASATLRAPSTFLTSIHTSSTSSCIHIPRARGEASRCQSRCGPSHAA